MADLYATLSRSIIPDHHGSFWKSSAEEGWTDTNAYWDTLLLGKVGQTQMLTGILFYWGRLDRTDTNAYWDTLLLGNAGQTPMLTGKHSESLVTLRKEFLLDEFLCLSFIVDTESLRDA